MLKIAILSTEIFGLIAMSIIMYGEIFESKHKSRKKTAFIALLVSVMIAITIDAISYLPINWNGKFILHFDATMAAFVSPFFVYAIFMHYVFLHIMEKIRVPRTLFTIGIVYCIIAIGSCIYYGLKGKLFIIKNGSFEAGEFYEGYLLTYVVVLAYTIIVVLVNGKKIGVHDSFATLIFTFIPVVFIIINLINVEMAFSISSLSLSMIVLNTMLQAERESHLIASEKVSDILAHYDKLTGLLNRLAFSEFCENMDNSGTIGIIFADVNGLKYTNDNYGHKSGDELLCNFANVMLGCFRKEDVFRISGDEFVILLPGMPEDTFERKSNILIEKINADDHPIASVGCVYGSKAEFDTLIDKAEEKMYEDKRLFHQRHPIYSR